MKRFTGLFICMMLVGCAARAKVVDPIVFREIAEHDPPRAEELIATPPVVLIPPGVAAVKAGEVIPADGYFLTSTADLPPFAGYLIATDDWLRLIEAYPRRIEEIEDLVAQIAADRQHCSTVDAAKIEAILACREAKKEAFFAGMGIGAGGCAVGGFFIDRAVP